MSSVMPLSTAAVVKSRHIVNLYSDYNRLRQILTDLNQFCTALRGLTRK